MEIKFCGTVSERDVNMVQASGASEVGIICRPDSQFYRPQPWRISQTVDTGKAIRVARASKEQQLTSVLLPRSTKLTEVVTMIEKTQPDRLQLGETEDLQLAKSVRNIFPELKIAQVIHVDDDVQPGSIDDFLEHVDMIHLDSAGEYPGGNGITHNWEISSEISDRAHAAGKLVILAGGLTSENVAEAIQTVRPDGVDVQSGIKCEWGTHNHQRGREFVSAVNVSVYP